MTTAAAAPPGASVAPSAAAPGSAATGALFVDATQKSGLDFVHFNGMTGSLLMPEMMGAGGALLDYDGDGDLDLFLVQGRMLEPGKLARALQRPRHVPPFSDRLYRNDLKRGPDGVLTPHFVDVTVASGLGAGAGTHGYGMGVATGDFDGDGWVDVYVTALGANRLLRNRGNGTFQDVTAGSGLAEESRWSVSASFFDYDRDGHLDLYVANYVDFRLEATKVCYSPSGKHDYCGPEAYEPQVNSLFHNRGNGTFEDVSERSGIRGFKGSSLGVVAADFDRDGWTDVYVANDKRPNELWMNKHDGTFRNDALIAGVAVNADGRALASMGVDAADCRATGREDLFMTNLTGEGSSFYVQEQAGEFADATRDRNLAAPSLPFTGFGTFFFDYDRDGWLDIFVANGLVGIPDDPKGHDPAFPLDQRKQLYRNRGDCFFVDVSAAAGPAVQLSEVSRGASVGDVDNDGDPDVVVMNNSGPARLLLDVAGAGRHWLGLRLVDRGGRHDVLGARAMVQPPGRAELWRRAQTDGSYAAARDPRVLFGLGAWAGPADVVVEWPGGARERFAAVPIDRYSTLVKGTAQPLK